ncbi:MAG TPA: N-acetyl-alpha-D-glucosaminyl L-malate synthase BshA [Candidatus Hydrogenedentes bacterium]|nr:N-acetyl-alpha-D-glucosaminyl L-malate synthase BshA [Candidatus Hydrogenedentota bacterium]
MRIGITCHPSAGGSGVLATELGIALAKRGHTIHFVTPESPFRLADYYDNVYSHAVSTVMYPLFHQPPGALTLAAKIAEVAEEFGVDLWHAHYAIPNASSAILAREMLPPEKRFPIVTTLHGTDITLVGTDPSFYRVTLHAMRNSDAVTAVSDWLRRETEREFAIERPVRVIHNFLDPDRFKPEPARRCRLADPDEKIVMHVSNFRPVKRVTDVVRAFKRILDRVPARLIMIGDGPERLSAVGVARQLGIADRIKYLGNQERVETIIPCANVVLQPSEHESFGLVALEAMACEVPVIGTDSGGVREVVEHGITGYLCEVGDIDSMAGYAIALFENPQRAREMGRQGRMRVRERFSQDQIVPKYEALYAEVAG